MKQFGYRPLTSDVKAQILGLNAARLYGIDPGVHRHRIFVPYPGAGGEDRGWVLALGYDAGRDETFLEIRDAGTMDFQARVWTGRHFPLGFHGNFYPA